ncbi:Protein of unknown function precursor [Flavobacterium indicum GPTSA100-9 = DSM 17447]|uniref:DUF547 domain-containing protein n=1 Tax=Flavobacterium indicum (strain DSM 17447 / CIP 109464 / GPTSA100-9) TaxID=1094466 RepID=H8XTQ6_FLAIG|nr:DUF547 domain-containing protein [Flavobacterium indicum]CCG53636.1 Protein of unknown function precursor [Flavobacterium indicum GPTSA100-9 = DSM 17447]
MKKTIILFTFLFSSFISNSQTIDAFFEQTNEFFKKYVSEDGKIDYKTIKKSPGELIYILDNASKLKVLAMDNKNVAKAFWINAYNLLVIKSAIDNYPTKSVNDIPGFFNENIHRIATQQLTLDDIENVILREIFFEPGIHFVLSSASNGGSPFIKGAYLPSNVDELIKKQAIFLINKDQYVRVNKNTKTIELSKIFDWYKKDFVTNYFDEIDFLNLFLNKKIDKGFTIKYYDFDWTLNQK